MPSKFYVHFAAQFSAFVKTIKSALLAAFDSTVGAAFVAAKSAAYVSALGKTHGTAFIPAQQAA